MEELSAGFQVVEGFLQSLFGIIPITGDHSTKYVRGAAMLLAPLGPVCLSFSYVVVFCYYFLLFFFGCFVCIRKGMFSFLSSFYKRCVECCDLFTSWKRSCDSGFKLVQPSPGPSAVCNIELCIDQSARSIFLSVQRVMADYKTVAAVRAGGTQDSMQLLLLLLLVIFHQYFRTCIFIF